MSKTTHAERLLEWYDRHHRDLPWRISPAARARGATPDPYRVWLSEVMLQQTTVEAVKRYFAAFLQRWPTVTQLAAADNDDVMKAWAGLGYYSRARNLKTCAEQVVERHGGSFPADFAALKALPGIGDYTAAAIAAIAFDIPAPVMDGNVERVVSRLFVIETPLPAAKRELGSKVTLLMPAQRPGDFAQAMMDLGAMICTPRRPTCALCPLNGDCAVLGNADPERFPVKAPKKERPLRRGAAFVAVAHDGSVYLVKRPEKGLLGGMAGVPTTGWTARADGATSPDAAPFAARWVMAGTVGHVFTHFELRLAVYRAEPVRPADVAGGTEPAGWWSPPDAIAGEALPTVMKKAIAAAKPGIFEPDRSRRATTA